MSLADEVVVALAEVRAIGEKVDNEHPMRHAIRSMKRTAEDIISNAVRQATDLAFQAQRLEKDYEDAAAAMAEKGDSNASN